MKQYLWVICLLTSFGASAQKEAKILSYTKAVNISPLAIGEIDNTAMIGGEYRYKNNLSVLADVGYVFYTTWTEEAKSTSGFTIRPAFRIYMGRQKSNYFQVQGSYKQVNYTIHDWLGKEVVNGVPAYDELQDFKYRKRITALSFMWGRMIPLFSDTWYADFYVGLGLRYRKLGVTSEENTSYTINRGIWGPPQERLLTPHLPLSIRITHTLQ